MCDECGTLSWTLPSAGLADTITRMKNTRPTSLPHQDFGDPNCCGCLDGIIRRDEVDIVCHECDAIICAADLKRTLAGRELALEVCNERRQSADQ